MGVPGLFLWFLKNYDKNNFIIKNLNCNIESLFLDTNCLLHPQCFKILENNKYLEHNKLEDKMIIACLEYIDYLIKYTNPSKLVYIAIDGVVPFAKIKQQRLRRFKSVKETRDFNNLKKKFNKPIDKNIWTNCSITPGTIFMDKLHNKIKLFIKNSNYKCKIIYSSCYKEMEGEHKILQYIKKNNIYNNYVIYGLDADLIFLSLTLYNHKIYLLRESNIVNNDDSTSLVYIDVDILKNIIVDEIKNNVVINKDIFSKKNIINDFIFICILLGNDFLPNIPSISLHSNKTLLNGLDILLYCYKKTFNTLQNYLFKINNSELTINLDIFVNFIDNLIIFEQDYFKKLSQVSKYYTFHNNSYEIAKKNLQNLNFKIKDPIMLGIGDFEEYKKKYYKHYYFILHNSNEIIEESCLDYLKGILWNLHYYFLDCKSWDWYYKFNKAPFISDIRKYIKNINLNNYHFNLSKPLKPLKQLFCVIPPQYSFLLPKAYQFYQLNEKSNLIYLFPRDFKLDMLYQHKYWKCLPIIPNISYNDLNILDNIKLLDLENNRNKIEEELLKESI
tara:strand:- start:6351 stop:8027 length:1677 start_codon:yes stop_codon:yes gene_type:complete